jgi:hypothetical protein
MSYTFHAYLLAARLPSAADLREALRQASSRVELPGVEDLASVRGFLPVLLDGMPTGFELHGAPITDREREAYRRQLALDGETSDPLFEILTACDLEFSFACRASDEREVTAARIVAIVLAELACGWFSDPQAGESVRFGG